jgi:hypothetical protein
MGNINRSPGKTNRIYPESAKSGKAVGGLIFGNVMDSKMASYLSLSKDRAEAFL